MILWKHIKGLNQSNNNDVLWSYIRFLNKTDNTTLTDFSNVPEIHLSTTDADTGAANLGHIITQNATNQYITNAFNFKSTLDVTGKLAALSTFEVTGTSKLNDDIALTGYHFFYFKKGNTDAGGRIFYSPAWSGSFNFESLSGGVVIASQDTSASIRMAIGGNLRAVFDSTGETIYGKCEANFFNATSDIRAKENLKPLEIKALDLIKKVPLYSFIYKETNTPSIGIIAQDVQSVQIDGFKLVDNEEATGKDMDYMTIHESKLTYILWKAIKEQQEIIDNLQAQINELKKN